MFRRKSSALDHLKALRENLIIFTKFEPTDKKFIKVSEEVRRNLSGIKAALYGSGDSESDVVPQLAHEICTHHTLLALVNNIAKLDFESRKDVGQILSNLLKRKIGTRAPTVNYIAGKPEFLSTLMNGYENPEVALNCGSMLRDCIRYEELAQLLLHSPSFNKFFDYVEMAAFDIASDAFTTLKDLLTKHKILAADFLEANYKDFFKNYDRLLNSESYVTKRQALKLLGELLLDRHNFSTMTLYISSPDNLKLMMNMLRQKSRSIQFEAFHVFKVFVANPNKPRPIQEVLQRNREKLVEFLKEFHNDRSDDDQFNEEKAYLIKQLQEMKALDPL